MTKPTKPSSITSQPRANEYQTLGDRIRYLRSQMKPVMTQLQLADRSKVSVYTVKALENGRKASNIEIKTIKKLAHALDCLVYITFKPALKPSLQKGEFPLQYPEAPSLSEWKGKASVQARLRALSNARSYKKNYRRRKYSEQHKVTSGKRDLGLPELNEPGE